MRESESLNLIADLADDDSRPKLAPLWAVLDSPVYLVVDEDGQNVANGRIRRLARRHWLYVDDMDGYSVVDDEDARRLCVVTE